MIVVKDPIMKKKCMLILAGLLAGCLSLQAQIVKPKSVIDGQPEPLWALNYVGTPLQTVLEVYGQITGRIMIKAPNVSPIMLDLVSEEKLPETEVLKAIETVLELNNISMVSQGTNFIIVKTADSMLQGPGIVGINDPNVAFAEDSTIIQQIIELKHITPAELQPVIQPMLHAYGKVQALERNNSLLIIDTKYNVQRVVEMLKLLDKPALRTEEHRVIQIEFAQSTEIAAKLQEIIAESIAENERNAASANRTPTSSRGTTAARTTTPPGIIRAAPRSTAQAETTGVGSFDLTGDAASRGLISGKPQIVADERSNILIIISRPENFPFFEEMIKVLDTKVEPEITFKNIRLEYADAEELSGIINELIGAAVSDTRPTGTTAGGRNDNDPANNSRTANTISDFINNQNRARTTQQTAQTANQAAAAVGGSLGEISENTQIIADPRTNSILIMGRNADIKVLERVVAELDIMLDQVLIEAVILEVSLNDNIAYGLDWLQRSLTVANTEVLGPRGGINSSVPVGAFGGGSRQGGSTFIDGATVTRATELSDGALSYFASFYDLNLDVVLTMAAGSSDARVLSTPVVLTTDNTEASIIVGERRPIPTATQQGLGTGVSRTSVDYENIGIELTVTPRINPQGFVVMEIDQSADNVGGNVVISGDEFPIITTRQLKASIAVQNGQTIVLGGLVADDKRDSRTKVPILGDFPILGTFFKSQRNEKNRTELLVLITPYVLSSIEEASRETQRLFNATKGKDHTWHSRWSDSPLNPDKDAVTPLSRFRFGRKADKEPATEANAADPVVRLPVSMQEAAPEPIMESTPVVDLRPSEEVIPKKLLLTPGNDLREANARLKAMQEREVMDAEKLQIEAEVQQVDDLRMQELKDRLKAAAQAAPKEQPAAPAIPDPPAMTQNQEEKIAALKAQMRAAQAKASEPTIAPIAPKPEIPAPRQQTQIAPTPPPAAVRQVAPEKPLTAAATGQAERVPSPPGSVPALPKPNPAARLMLPPTGQPRGVPAAPQISPAPPPPVGSRIEQRLNTNAPPPRALNQISSKKLILDNSADK
jgi:general secretion pathway protein D